LHDLDTVSWSVSSLGHQTWLLTICFMPGEFPVALGSSAC